jgi:hypothetical protein
MLLTFSLTEAEDATIVHEQISGLVQNFVQGDFFPLKNCFVTTVRLAGQLFQIKLPSIDYATESHLSQRGLCGADRCAEK